MSYPIVNVTTRDGLLLHGLLTEPVKLLKTENSRAEVYQVENSDHVFSGKEAEVIALIADFMQRKILV